MSTLSIVTVADVLNVGACYDGVVAWVKRHKGVIAVDPATEPKNEWIQKAAKRDGDGEGNGNGYGDGYGYGDGDGDGDGDGYGYGK